MSMMTPERAAQYVNECVPILRKLDVAAMKDLADRYDIKPFGDRPPEFGDASILAGMHKVRLFLPDYFTREEIEASREWLRTNGLRDSLVTVVK